MVGMDSIPWTPVLRYATPLPLNRTPVSTVVLQHKSVSFVLRYATPLPINRTPVSTVGGPFPLFCGTPGLVSIACSIQAGWLPCVPLPPDEHDAFRCLPMKTTTTLFLRSDRVMYVCASRRSRPCPYVRTWPYFLSCTLAAIRTCTCYVRASTSMTCARLYIDQYVRTRSRPE